ncbi:MAG: helix-hairpin-helix domain-containing protein [Dehalococcoidia bacterium]|nr:helix-hairpin-helix domain-containing protein [Dehalococcoidia bacterium]
METGKKDTAWIIFIVLLLVMAVTGGYTFLKKRTVGEQLVIRQPAPGAEDDVYRVYIEGAVVSPGFYSISGGQSLADAIQAAGGSTVNDGSGDVIIRIVLDDGQPQPQKVNVNTAEGWLLEALPQVGPSTAKEIMDYRRQNGPFDNISDLLNVKGIGPAKFKQIKEFVTVN